MDPKTEQRPDDPGPGPAPAAPDPPPPVPAVTLGGTDAGPQTGPNPAIGSPHVWAPPEPKQVIHNAGDARPGDSNPAAAQTTPAGGPTGNTAEFLAAREDAEEALSRQARAGSAFADSTPDPSLARADQLDPPPDYEAFGSGGAALGQTNARVEAKTEANRK
ncbi:MAG TPA: hypothetical protein VKY74_14865, partial [Chloroflexia bacterium]|nr:hypothetical protein [Chloroflexia bacterium]